MQDKLLTYLPRDTDTPKSFSPWHAGCPGCGGSCGPSQGGQGCSSRPGSRCRSKLFLDSRAEAGRQTAVESDHIRLPATRRAAIWRGAALGIPGLPAGASQSRARGGSKDPAAAWPKTARSLSSSRCSCFRRRSSETKRRTHDKAWAAVLYSEATEAPASPRRRLALALGVPETALRLGPGLHLPGVAVEVARLPRGLPDLEFTPELRAGVLGKKGEMLALGPPDLTQSLGMTDVSCPAHRYTIVLRNLSEQKVAEGSYDERLEAIS
eukprot:s5873_g1.t1